MKPTAFLLLLGCLCSPAALNAQPAYGGDRAVVYRGIAGQALLITGETVPYESGDLFLVDTLTGKQELLAGGNNVFGATFSPEGNAVAYTQGGKIKILDLKTREVREIGSGGGPMNWTEDGFIYYAGSRDGQHHIFRIPAAGGGEAESVFEKGGPHFVNIDVSRDGKQMVWTQPGWSVWHIDFTTMETQQVGWGCNGGGVASAELGSFLHGAGRPSNFRISFEAVITPAVAETAEATFIVGFKSGDTPASWGIWQDGNKLIWKNRMNQEEYGPELILARAESDIPVHVMLVFSGRGARAYVNGRWVVDNQNNAGIGRWADQPFGFGSETGGGWRGRISHVTAYRETFNLNVASDHAQALSPERDKGPFHQEAVKPLVQMRGELAKPANTWPEIREGLTLAVRDAASPVRAFRPDGQPMAAASLSPLGMGRLDPDNALRLSHGGFILEEAAAHAVKTAAEAGAFTLRAWIAPDVAAADPAPILTLGPNLRLEQRGLDAWLVTPGQTQGVKICKLSPFYGNNLNGELMEVALTWAGDRLTVYKDGRYVAAYEVEAGFADWQGGDLLIGNPNAETQGFTGRLEAVALYNRALDEEEIRQDHDEHLARIQARRPRETVQFKSKLIGMSEAPDLDAIAPYTRALVVYEYQVEQIFRGDRSLNGKTIRVAHWSHMDNQKLPILDARLDKVYMLRLESMDEHPQLGAQAVSDTLDPDFDIPMYHDITPPGLPIKEED
ncbi:MAG: hypothetical protein JJU29_09095 [Verrucomicrobia bacterium]|nr:hypothetical protein [Verrucomicrobiota bacterium]MCH8511808.1 hypothetical protein [Kiritimatiellia bacterium]